MGRKLPPGQIETKRFPVVGERAPSTDLVESGWNLEMSGLVESPFTVDLDAFRRTATSEIVFDIHCVTSWTRFDSSFTGIPLVSLIERARPAAEARFVSFEAYSSRHHHTSLPLAVALADSWLVHEFEGRPLDTEHGGPVRVVTTGRYFYKSLKWVRRIVLLTDDRPGWWEENSRYHNNAEPWSGRERFTTGSIRPQQVHRFLEAPIYDKYRGRLMIGLDLRVWRPQTVDLSGLHLKSCDMRGVDLSGADLRRSNLSLCDLRDARLIGADLSGSDLEGANFVGADLTGANLEHTALTAARFGDGAASAILDGTRFDGSWGLTESQETLIRR